MLDFEEIQEIKPNVEIIELLKHYTYTLKTGRIKHLIHTNLQFIQLTEYLITYPILKVAKTNKFYDRFIVIDNKEMYHLGASIKDLGKKCFGINKIEYMQIIEKVINI